MPVMQREVNVVTLTTNPNLLTGSVFEFARGNVLMMLGVTAAATGSFVTINSGADVVLEESAPVVATRFPIIPDEMYYADVAAGGDRIIIAVRNPTGGDIVHRALVQITNV
jgi:hypothetical protein